MACLYTLKAEIKAIAEVFPPNPNARFQVQKATLDEISCRFIGSNGRKFDIHANITVSFCIFYPLKFIQNGCPKKRNTKFLLVQHTKIKKIISLNPFGCCLSVVLHTHSIMVVVVL